MNTTIDLNDLRTAFTYKDTKELRYTWMIYYLISKPRFVKVLKWLTLFGLKYGLPIKPLIRKTAFNVFCAGENTEEAFQTIKKLHQYKIKAVLDYVSEAEKTVQAFESNAEKIIDNIRTTKDGVKCDYISIKLSGLEDPECLTYLSKTEYYHDEKRFIMLTERLKKICLFAAANKVMVYIDSEESWMQEVIDRIAEKMMSIFNKKRVVVFNTLQMYRTDRVTYLEKLLMDASKAGYKPGIKLVRGAYHEKEILVAENEGRPIPVFITKEETDLAFNRAIDLCFAAHEHVCTCIATHNEESILYALEAIDRYGIKDHTTSIQFSQLFGMSDNISFNLAANGFNTSKYLPYGEIEKAIPYLMRRADENTSVNGQMTREFRLLSLEVKRRNTYYA